MATLTRDVKQRLLDRPGGNDGIAPLEIHSVVTSCPGSSGRLTVDPSVVKILQATVHQEVKTALSLAPAVSAADSSGMPGTDDTFLAPISCTSEFNCPTCMYRHICQLSAQHCRPMARPAWWPSHKLAHSNTPSSLGQSSTFCSHRHSCHSTS